MKGYKKYDKYKDAGIEWIGKIPEHWEVSKIKYIADYINGYAFKPTDWNDYGKKIIRIQNLTDPNYDYNYYDGEIPKKYIVKKGDILLSWSATLGIHVWNDEEAVLNQHIFKVLHNENLITE